MLSTCACFVHLVCNLDAVTGKVGVIVATAIFISRYDNMAVATPC